MQKTTRHVINLSEYELVDLLIKAEVLEKEYQFSRMEGSEGYTRFFYFEKNV